MNQAFIDACTAVARTLDRAAVTPTGPLGYGRDLDCIYDATTDLREVDPQSPEAVGQAILRRLISPRGSVVDDANYGFDLRGLCNRGVDQVELQKLQPNVQNECRKDDRVADVVCTLTQDAGTRTIDCKLVVTLIDSGSPFTLVFAVSSADQLVEII